MAWNDGLTGRPLEIAGSQSRNIRILAGPGTGKTFSLKKRVTRLLEEGIDPKKILVVTFTRVAARDLLKELNAIGIEGCNHLNIGTIHRRWCSLCRGLDERMTVLSSGVNLIHEKLQVTEHNLMSQEMDQTWEINWDTILNNSIIV